ncbi:MAG: hypothetical protein OEW15_09325 [Nitrospirota bacterium]|nr:hypothetical protein [Nitrospirota bacterium]
MTLDAGNAQGSDEGSARVRRLRDEIQRVIEREYSLAGKYQELAAMVGEDSRKPAVSGSELPVFPCEHSRPGTESEG